MKLYAQVGYGLGEKVGNALALKFIDGAIFSPKDLQKDTLAGRISELRKSHETADVFVDPQYYASLYAGSPNSNMGNLPDWNYFKAYRLGALEKTSVVRSVLASCFDDICSTDVTSIIAPSISISQSFDSREAVVAKTFLREARDVYDKKGDKRPLYASLVIGREALQDQREFEYFVDDISMLDSPPDGIYLAIAGRTSEAKTEIFHADVIANWMFLNHALSLNGISVINGYSDILTPFLGVAGGAAGATGWWSNLRTMSMEKYLPSKNGGGRQPIVRYLSKALMNRITFAEKDVISGFVPEIINGLSCDSRYDSDPDRIDEILQSWEALRSLADYMCANDIIAGIDNCRKVISYVQATYTRVSAIGIPLDYKSRDDHSAAMAEGLEKFVVRAEVAGT